MAAQIGPATQPAASTQTGLSPEQRLAQLRELAGKVGFKVSDQDKSSCESSVQLESAVLERMIECYKKLSAKADSELSPDVKRRVDTFRTQAVNYPQVLSESSAAPQQAVMRAQTAIILARAKNSPANDLATLGAGAVVKQVREGSPATQKATNRADDVINRVRQLSK